MEGPLYYEVILEEYCSCVEAHRQGDTRRKLRIPTLFEEACYHASGHIRTAWFLRPAGMGQNRGRLRQNHEAEGKRRLRKTSAVKRQVRMECRKTHASVSGGDPQHESPEGFGAHRLF
jgi:hypothetical protein